MARAGRQPAVIVPAALRPAARGLAEQKAEGRGPAAPKAAVLAPVVAKRADATVLAAVAEEGKRSPHLQIVNIGPSGS
jgi:hypothetical protein